MRFSCWITESFKQPRCEQDKNLLWASNLEYIRTEGAEMFGMAERKSRFDDPEEIFAEDFRWLFGTEKANQVEYRPSCPEPGDRGKTWILEKLG